MIRGDHLTLVDVLSEENKNGSFHSNESCTYTGFFQVFMVIEAPYD